MSNQCDTRRRHFTFANHDKRRSKLKKHREIADINSMSLEDSLSYLIGAYLGDGCTYIGKNSYQFSITSEDKDLCAICNDICLSLFSKVGNIKEVKKNDIISYYQLVICSKKIVLFLKDITNNKTTIPEIIYKNNKTMISFIQGIMDTDGWICKINPSDGYTRYRVGFKNVSCWTKQIHNILTTLDIKIGKLRKIKNTRYGKPTQDTFNISINTKDYCNKIGFRLKRKQELTKEALMFYESGGNKSGKKNI